MAETIKALWLTDEDQVKIAPKTLSSQIINEDGTLFKNTLNEELDILESDLKSYTEDLVSEVDQALINITIGNKSVKEAEHAIKADHATTADNATKATQDASGNVITDTYETKSDAQTKFDNAKAYVDSAIANSSQIQMITWEDDD